MSSFNAAAARAKRPCPLWVDAFYRDTQHLQTDEIGAYLLILMAMWSREACDIQDDDVRLAKVCRVSLRLWKARIGPALRSYFQATNGSLVSKRLREEAAYVERQVTQQSDRKAGKKHDNTLKYNGRGKSADHTVDHSADHPSQQPNNPTEAGAVAGRAPAPAIQPVLVAEGPDLGALLGRVMAAVGLNPNDIPSAHWMPNVAEQHLLGWLNAGIPPDAIERVAGESRQRHRDPPNGPKALDGAMRAWLTARSAPAFTAPVIPLETGSSDARRPSRASRLDRVLNGAVARAEARTASLDRGPGEDAPRELLRPAGR